MTLPFLSSLPSNPVLQYQLIQITLTQAKQQVKKTVGMSIDFRWWSVQHLVFLANFKLSIFLDKEDKCKSVVGKDQATKFLKNFFVVIVLKINTYT